MALPAFDDPPAADGFFAKAKQFYSNRIDAIKEAEDAQNIKEPLRSVMTHQVEALRKIESHFQTYPGSMATVVMPTGTGKSLVALLSLFLCGNRKALIITPSKVISEQLLHAAVGHGPEASVFVQRQLVPATAPYAPYRPSASIQSNQHIFATHSTNIVIVNAQKFSRVGDLVQVDHSGQRTLNVEAIPQDTFDMVVVDEAHHYPAASWDVVVKNFANRAHSLFLTATPPPSSDFPPEIYRFSRQIAIKKQVIRATQWLNSTNTAASLAESLSSNLRQAMVLAADTAACDKVVETCTHVGLHALPYYGTNLEANKVNFTQKKSRVLVVCGKLLEGFDYCGVSVCGFNHATQSYIRFVQFVGRAVRVDRKNLEGDPVAIIFGPPALQSFYTDLETEEERSLPLLDPPADGE